jgi:hypothetical protein
LPKSSLTFSDEKIENESNSEFASDFSEYLNNFEKNKNDQIKTFSDVSDTNRYYNKFELVDGPKIPNVSSFHTQDIKIKDSSSSEDEDEEDENRDAFRGNERKFLNSNLNDSKLSESTDPDTLEDGDKNSFHSTNDDDNDNTSENSESEHEEGSEKSSTHEKSDFDTFVGSSIYNRDCDDSDDSESESDF